MYNIERAIEGVAHEADAYSKDQDGCWETPLGSKKRMFTGVSSDRRNITLKEKCRNKLIQMQKSKISQNIIFAHTSQEYYSTGYVEKKDQTVCILHQPVRTLRAAELSTASDSFLQQPGVYSVLL